MAASSLSDECSLPEPPDNSVSPSTTAEESGHPHGNATPPSEHHTAQMPSGPKDDSIQQASGSEDIEASCQVLLPEEKKGSDRYGLIAAQLASRATEEEINFIKAQIKGLEARKETLEGLLEQANTATSAEFDNANRDDGNSIVAIPSLKSLEWEDFVNLTWCDCIDYINWAQESGVQLRPYAIDVLMGNARYFWQRGADPEPQNHGNLPVVPERIRVNSRPLMAFLSKLTSRIDGITYSKVIMRPYKILLQHETSIRERAEELGRKWGHLADRDYGTRESNKHSGSDAKGPDLQTSPPPEPQVPASMQLLEATATDQPQDETNSHVGDGGDMAEDSVELWRDLLCLIEFLDRWVLPAVKTFESNAAQKARFQDLWYLFKPGDDILLNNAHKRAGRSTEKYAVWRVFHVTGGRPLLSSEVDKNPLFLNSRAKMSPFSVKAYRIVFDGQKYGPVSKRFVIDPFTGQKDITSLDMYPLRFATNKNTILKDLEESGKNFIDLTSSSGRNSHRHRNYVGTTFNVDHAGDFCRPAGETIAQVGGQVIIDFEEAYQDDPEWVPSSSLPTYLVTEPRECDDSQFLTCWKDAERTEFISKTHRDVFADDLAVDEELTEHFMANDKFLSAYKSIDEKPNLDSSYLSEKDLLLLPKQVCAFVLNRRAFALLNIDGLEPFVAQDGGWGDLKLPKGHKNMVEAQTMSHFHDKTRKIQARQRDMIQGKGQGLIILLHGFPGVGKTSTAECLAAKLGYPLYPITCGDLGTTVELVEKRLETIFSKAQKWNCVLLLDEADVFLAERTKTDIERNALVSLFLRTLEYYDGLLFLTTNRVGTLDEAFKSRIHMTLYYPPLNIAQMRAIWEVNLKRIQRYRDDIDPDINEILAYPDELWYELEQEGRSQWNGRQIRNAFQTALALAESDHLKQHPELLGDEQPDQPHTTKVRLEKNHFVTVAKTINTFDDYLGTTHHGNSHSKIAFDRGQRADNYGRPIFRQHTPDGPYYAGPNSANDYDGYNRGGGAYALATPPPPSRPMYGSGGGGPPPSNPNAAAYYAAPPPDRPYPGGAYNTAPSPTPPSQHQPSRSMLRPPASQQQQQQQQQQHNYQQGRGAEQNLHQQYHDQY